MDAEDGKLSSKGLYKTDRNGMITLSGLTGTVIVTEESSIPGFAIDEQNRSQTVVVNSDDTQQIYFYNAPVSGILIHKISSVDGEGIYGAHFLLYDAHKNPIGEYVSDQRGYVHMTT